MSYYDYLGITKKIDSQETFKETINKIEEELEIAEERGNVYNALMALEYIDEAV